jgi:hypothetical protein
VRPIEPFLALARQHENRGSRHGQNDLFYVSLLDCHFYATKQRRLGPKQERGSRSRTSTGRRLGMKLRSLLRRGLL